MHLGMTGRFEIEGGPGGGPASSPRRPGRSQARPRRLRDRRRRARHLLRPPALRLHGPDRRRRTGRPPWFAGLGPEPLGPDFDGAHLASAFAGRKPERQDPAARPADRRRPRQHLCLRGAVPGPHLARPKPAGDDPSPPARSAWSPRSRPCWSEAIDAGGSTLRDFAATDGALGYFQHRFAVYDREGEPCHRPGCNGVIRARSRPAARPSIVPCARHDAASPPLSLAWTLLLVPAPGGGGPAGPVDRARTPRHADTVRLGPSAAAWPGLGAARPSPKPCPRRTRLWFELPIDAATAATAQQLALEKGIMPKGDNLFSRLKAPDAERLRADRRERGGPAGHAGIHAAVAGRSHPVARRGLPGRRRGVRGRRAADLRPRPAPPSGGVRSRPPASRSTFWPPRR